VPLDDPEASLCIRTSVTALPSRAAGPARAPFPFKYSLGRLPRAAASAGHSHVTVASEGDEALSSSQDTSVSAEKVAPSVPPQLSRWTAFPVPPTARVALTSPIC